MANSCREQILSEDYRDFLVSNLQEDLFREKFPSNACEQEIGFFYKSIYVNQEQADPIQFDRYPYNSVPKCFTLLDASAMEQAGILAVQNYPTLSLQGSGVLIGFVDTGVRGGDFFLDEYGESRILSVWDQTMQEGESPEGFDYGTELRGEEVSRRSTDESGHGSRMVSAALKAAPSARIVMVKCRRAKTYLREFYGIPESAEAFAEDDIMAGFTYLERVAARENRPMVLCVTMGTNMGDHSGSSLLAEIDKSIDAGDLIQKADIKRRTDI